ncbi:glycerophosphodiester phosphodiesterase family protein [Confluentibacter sediminis]|uniref:glycerophosphodiester phosphodiesterase family protein n=1 Tax=Confluentibacter sediminis TaxID=2219045 RepID=UPI000DACEF17|nr:glycerophosphodiester phosphodiesterase family protein [Confluentibacter sediminis]
MLISITGIQAQNGTSTESITATSQSKLDSILFDFHNRPEMVLVAAHRAAHTSYPENSLPAMREAIRLGVDIIEVDVRETKDGVLVCIHDKTIDRTTTGKGKVENMTYAELQDYFLLHDGKPTLEKIPAFKEVLELVKGKIMLDIDYKADGKRAALSTTKLLRDMNIEKQCLFFLYDYKDAIPLYKMNNKLQFLVRAYTAEDVGNILKMKEPSCAIHGDDDCYSDTLMKQIRSSGKRVWMNALGKYDDMEKTKRDSGFDVLLQKKQMNMIQTDFPEALLSYLREKGLHR